MTIVPEQINNINELIELTKLEGELKEMVDPAPIGYVLEKQQNETWHFILTNNISRSTFRLINVKKNYQVYSALIKNITSSVEDLPSFLSNANLEEKWELFTHIHDKNPQYILVIRIFHHKFMPVKSI